MNFRIFWKNVIFTKKIITFLKNEFSKKIIFRKNSFEKFENRHILDYVSLGIFGTLKKGFGMWKMSLIRFNLESLIHRTQPQYEKCSIPCSVLHLALLQIVFRYMKIDFAFFRLHTVSLQNRHIKWGAQQSADRLEMNHRTCATQICLGQNLVVKTSYKEPWPSSMHLVVTL